MKDTTSIEKQIKAVEKELANLKKEKIQKFAKLLSGQKITASLLDEQTGLPVIAAGKTIRASDIKKLTKCDLSTLRLAEDNQDLENEVERVVKVFDEQIEELSYEQDREIDKKLEALHRRFGKRPNIIYVLADDVGWGEMGWQGGGKHRGTPTPELDKMALEGMRFWSAYAEPSCTPSRIAINTGRHPVRTGLLAVLWPGQTDGLSGKEVTVAEVLSEAGYNTVPCKFFFFHIPIDSCVS